MKNVSLLLSLLFAGNGVFCQQIYTEVDLTLTFTFDSPADSSIIQKEVESPDTIDNTSWGETWRWNQEFDAWAGESKWEFGYDSAGQAISYLDYWWSMATGDWSYGWKHAISYDSAGHVKEDISWAWLSMLQEWRYYYRTWFTHDSAGNNLIQESSYWNGEEWTSSSRHENVYDSAGNNTLYQAYFWDGDLQRLVPSTRQEYTYDSNGNEILNYRYEWDRDSESWIRTNGWKYEYFYNDSGRDTLTISYDWSIDSEEWVPAFRYETLIDPGGSVSSRDSYRWDPGTSSWIREFRFETRLDTAGNLKLAVVSEWDPGMEEFRVTRKTYVYRDCAFYTLYDHTICNGDSLLVAGNYQKKGTSRYEILQTTGGRDSIVERYLDVYPNPLSFEIQGETLVYEDQISQYNVSGYNYSTFNWNIENGTILSYPDENSVEVQWGTGGDGTIFGVAEDAAGCMTDTSKLMVYVRVVGIERTGDPELLIYPNPAPGRIMIRSGDDMEQDGFVLRVLDQSGRVINETILVGSVHEYTFPSETGPGLYIVQVSDTSNEIIATRKIVVE